MNQDSPFLSYDREDKLMDPMTLPPLNFSYSDQMHYEIDPPPYSVTLERRMRLESHVSPLEDVVRGAPYLPFCKMPTGHDATYHVQGAIGKENPYCYTSIFNESDYPSPPGPPATDLSSISESDRSPSPRAVGHYYYPSIPQRHCIHPVHPVIQETDFQGYGSVTPREIQHIPEPEFQEPNFPVDKIAQIYDPCPSSYVPVGGASAEHDSNDDADADGDVDAAFDPCLDTEQTPTASRTKAKSSSRHQRKKTAKQASPRSRKRGALLNPGNKAIAKSGSKDSGATGRVFLCTFMRYGCNSSFTSKNEWKRHVMSQHLKLGFWRCDLPGCYSLDKPPNDFNRKDLFTQHLRRMHSSGHTKNSPSTGKDEEFERTLPEHHERCCVKQRSPPPQTGCALCEAVFRTWEERMEHMGKHYETGSFDGEPEDRSLVEWALHNGILCEDGPSKGLTLTSLITSGRK